MAIVTASLAGSEAPFFGGGPQDLVLERELTDLTFGPFQPPLRRIAPIGT